ncbi:MAG: TetR/AcrR family transcriptional regulator [Mycobacterium kyogaense]|uniref:TetR/AcrR family transcriptional regulator n=1 Tax=Mycobacterium kyogaense TaxID=2212479 RepID=UPI002FFC5974
MGADSERTKQVILRAARDVIAESGYPAATFQQIALRAGISRPTLHYYFEARDQIYETLVAAVNTQIAGFIAEARRHVGPRSQLVAFTQAVERVCDEDPGALRFLVTVQVEQRRGVHSSSTAGAVIAALHDFYASLADAAPVDDRRGLTELLASVFWGVAFHAGFVACSGEASIVARQLHTVFDDELLTSQNKAS